MRGQAGALPVRVAGPGGQGGDQRRARAVRIQGRLEGRRDGEEGRAREEGADVGIAKMRKESPPQGKGGREREWKKRWEWKKEKEEGDGRGPLFGAVSLDRIMLGVMPRTM